MRSRLLSTQQIPTVRILGEHPAVQALRLRINRLATSTLSILIRGESGTGKDLVARALHAASGRSGPLVSLNCSALSESLLESELFGHDRGAFTGADRTTPGLFSAAHGGTLFLDEIADLPATLQPKLLRAVETGEVRRVGSAVSQRVDIRIVSATNRDLASDVARGLFRRDLYMRLRHAELAIPSLRERRSDIAALAEEFLARESRSLGRSHVFSGDVIGLLERYDWPGNIRELENLVKVLVTLAVAHEITSDELPPEIRDPSSPLESSIPETPFSERFTTPDGRFMTAKEAESAHIREALRRCDGVRGKAASLLGLPRTSLYRRMEILGIEGRSRKEQ
jgi:two-component system, NtrC family, response regulator HydG